MNILPTHPKTLDRLWLSPDILPSVTFKRFALFSSLLLLAVLPVYNGLAPAHLHALLAKDNTPASGLVEHLTVLVLLPGIAAGLYAFVKYRHSEIHGLFSYWPLLWAIGCVYFAGEEASWGQWYFGWETPANIAEVNDQGETNLHNMTSWLDQKPRALVEIFIVAAGFVLPFWHTNSRNKGKKPKHPLTAFAHWITPPLALMGPAALFLFVRIFDWITHPAVVNLGDSELREFTIAWFLTLYLFDFAFRSRHKDKL